MAMILLAIEILTIVGTLYAIFGTDFVRWVDMGYRFLQLRLGIKRFVKKKWTVADFFEDCVAKYPNATAISFEGQELSYRELECMANRVAAWGLARNLKPQDVVALMMGNSPEFIATWLGLSKIGVITALLNTNLRGDSLKHSIAIANPKAIISTPSFSSEITQAAEELKVLLYFLTPNKPILSISSSKNEKDEKLVKRSKDSINPYVSIHLESFAKLPPSSHLREGILPTDVLFYIYTSGTTGLPKAAKISHARFYAGGAGFGAFNRITDKDRIYCCLPLYHSAGGVIGVSVTWWAGATLILSRKFSSSRFFKECRDTKATVIQYIGQICRYLNSTPPSVMDRTHSVRKAIGNGMRLDTWKKFKARFGIPYIGEFYASTEGNAVLINNQNKEGAVGYVPPIADKLPFVNYPLKIIRINLENMEPIRKKFCEECKFEEVGELIGKISKRHVDRRFDGYLDEKATNKKILKDVFRTGDKWFRTGDLFRRDERGFYYFVDRIGDTFRWRGENVATSMLTQTLNTCPAPKICDACVYGVNVPGQDGKAGMACIQLSSYPVEQTMLKRLYAHCALNLPKYAIPVFLRVREGKSTMDLTTTFKHKKTRLQKEGFTPSLVRGDSLFVLISSEKTWLKLDADRFRLILEGKLRF